MEFIIGAVLMLPLYLAAGITVARQRYTAENKTAITDEVQESIDALKAKKSETKHSRWCNSNYSYDCDCHCSSLIGKIDSEIDELSKPTLVEPKMGTIVTWPGYLLKRAALKVYTPRPKHVPVYDNYDEVSGAATESPYLVKIRDMEERHQQRQRIESDPLYKKLAGEWDKVEQAYAKDFAPKINTKKGSRC